MTTNISIDVYNDTHIDQEYPDTEYKTANYLNLKTLVDENRRIYFEFDLSTLPRPYCNINSLTVYCYVTFLNPESTHPEIGFYALNEWDWGSNTVTWNNQLSCESLVDFTKSSVIVSSWLSEDILGYMHNDYWVAEGVGYKVQYTTEDEATSKTLQFNSEEHGTNPIYIVANYDDYEIEIGPSDYICRCVLCSTSEYCKYRMGHAIYVCFTDYNVGLTEGTLKFQLPWGGAEETEILDELEWSSVYSSGNERYQIQLYNIYPGGAPPLPCDGGKYCTVKERYWNTGDLYVKTDGNDAFDGTSWSTAWETITHAANVADDGKTVRIGFGTYNDETDITPDNFSTSGIKYLPETATTGGGTGSVTINL